MDLAYNEEQSLLRESAEKVIRDRCSVERLIELRENGSGLDAALWDQMAELGWLGLPFDEEDGGLSYGLEEVAVITEELGRGLAVVPYVTNVVVCGGLLRRCDPVNRERWLPGLIAGETQWALAFAEQRSRYHLDRVSVTATPVDGGLRVSGEKIAVLNGATADELLVTARTQDGAVALLRVSGADVARSPVVLIDGSAGANLQFKDAPAEMLLADALGPMEQMIDEAIVAMGAQALGSMQALLAMTIEYTQTREQFGQPIGKFQVLQHTMADMYMQCETLRSLLFAALVAGPAELPRAASALKVKLGEAGRFVSQQAVQLHGGVGMSDELGVSHHFKQLLLLNTMFGDIQYHLDRYDALSAA